MSDLVRFDVGISGGLITSAEGKWVSYASHCASRDALVNVVDAQANEIERLRAWQRRAIQSMRWHAHCEVCAALVAEVGAP